HAFRASGNAAWPRPITQTAVRCCPQGLGCLVNFRRLPMRRTMPSWLALSLVPLVAMSVFADENARQADRGQKATRDTLSRFEAASKREPARGDPVWKVRMDALVTVVKAGSVAVPILIDALKNGPPATRDFAAQALAIFADPAAQPALLGALDDPDVGTR